jgi:hypothetical protein
MKISRTQIIPVLLAIVCLLNGCAQESQTRGSAGIPVRVGVQGEEPLPVKLNSDANNSIFIEFSPSNVALPVKLQSGPNDRLPVALVLENGQVLPIKIKSDTNSPFPVILQVQSDKPLPVVLNLKEPLPVVLNIKEPLPVQINIPSKILALAIAAITLIALLCIGMLWSCRRKQG